MNGACISADGLHRTRLWRIWEPEKPRMLLVMLNPSTADASLDDPTIVRGVGFAKREGCGGLEVANLYSYRTPSPSVLKAKHYPTSADNDAVLRALLGVVTGPVVCGWGVHAKTQDAEAFRAMAFAAGVTLFHLGVLNTNGSPRHPLYLRSNTPLLQWSIPGGVENLEEDDSDEDIDALMEMLN